jgi:hypothetical protein
MHRPPPHPSRPASDRKRAAFAVSALVVASSLSLALVVPRSTQGAKPAAATSATASAAASTGADATESAAALKAKGDAAFDTFHYGDALRFYEQAHALSNDPALLYNRARALQALGRNPEALALFERFQLEAPKDLQAKVPGLSKLVADMRARVATLRVKCNVDGAQIIVGDRVLGDSGAVSDVRLDAGSVVLRVQKEGYFPVKREVQLVGGTSTTIDVLLQSRATSGVLAVAVDPPAARVTIDGKVEGNAPLELVLPVGTHELTITAPGYEPLSSKAVVKADARADVRLTMQETPGITSRWWFWAGVGTVVVAGVVVTIALTTDRPAPSGNFSPPRVGAPLITF